MLFSMLPDFAAILWMAHWMAVIIVAGTFRKQAHGLFYVWIGCETNHSFGPCFSGKTNENTRLEMWILFAGPFPPTLSTIYYSVYFSNSGKYFLLATFRSCSLYLRVQRTPKDTLAGCWRNQAHTTWRHFFIAFMLPNSFYPFPFSSFLLICFFFLMFVNIFGLVSQLIITWVIFFSAFSVAVFVAFLKFVSSGKLWKSMN